MRTARPGWLSLIAVQLVAASTAPGQTHLEKVRALRLDSLPVGAAWAYYSEGRRDRAQALAPLVDGMTAFYARRHGWDVSSHVAVLTEPDWRRSFENPYGVPGVRTPGPISFLAADVEAGAVYRDAMPLRDNLGPTLKSQIDSACTSFERCVLLGADALIAHELGHLYEGAAGIGRPNRWLAEFVAHYFAYAYLHERRSPHLAPYVLLHRVYASASPELTTLQQFDGEEGNGEMSPREYGRFQSLFVERIEQVYPRQGLGFIAKLAATFPRQGQPTGCSRDTGRCDSERLPVAEVLRRLEQLEPGFYAWAATLGTSRR